MPFEAAPHFDAYPPAVREKLYALRRLIFLTAAETAGVGALEETLKWGQPSYLTGESKSGSTIRIDQTSRTGGQVAMYFNCKTTLVETFRQLYPDDFAFDGSRAILFDADAEIPVEALKHCIALALTYHLDKKRRIRTHP